MEKMLGNKKYILIFILPALLLFLGFTLIPLVTSGIYSFFEYNGISTDYYEAAQIDGASTLQVHMKITLPLLVPVIKTCVIFAITGSLRAFDLVYVMTGGGPNHISEVPATLMYNNLFRKGLYGYGSAQAFFIVIECLIFTFIVNRIFKKAEQNVSAV